MVKKRYLFGLALGLFAASCSCDGSKTDTQHPEMVLDLSRNASGDYVLDFGDVTVGARAIERIELRNGGNTPLVVEAERPSSPFSFELPSGGLTVGVGESTRISFAFAPLEGMEKPREVEVSLSTNEGGAKIHRVRLIGRGVVPSLDCSPGTVDFGPVVKGRSKTLTTSCTNSLDVPLELAPGGFTGNFAQSFSILNGGEDGEEGDERLPIAPGETVELRLQFRAESLGMNDATLMLRDVNKQSLAVIPVLGETVASALRLDPQGCLDFEYVGIGKEAQRALRVSNIGSQEVRILGFRFPAGASTDFSVATTAPVRLLPGAEPSEILVNFAPISSGKRAAELELLTDDTGEGGGSLMACLTGFGGGPELSCSPDFIDFGMVAIDIPVIRTYRCTNTGVPPEEGATVDPLTLTAVSSDSPLFEPSILNDDGTTGFKAEGYLSGEGFTVAVRYSPVAETFDEGAITLESPAALGGSHSTAVAGQGRDLPPCDFSLEPPALRFGIVDRGAELKQSFGIRNNGDTACLINDLRLSDGSDPAFSVEPIESYELPGDSKLEVEVLFAPTQYKESIVGKVQFQISNPATPTQQVALSGTAAAPCLLIDPAEVDFGKARPLCLSRERLVTVMNVCATPLKITAVEVNDTLHAGDFQMVRRPPIGTVVEPNSREEFTMTFTPSALGPVTGAVAVEVQAVGSTGADVYLAPLRGEGSDAEVQTDVFNQPDKAKVDILFVMDNSGSMEPYQTSLGQNLPAFLEYAELQRIDYHIAVTTTGVVGLSGGGCPGGSNYGLEQGRFFPIDGSHPRILTPDTPALTQHWKYNIAVGTCQAEEYPYEAARMALSPPLINEKKDSRPYNPATSNSPTYQDGNAGFLRSDAALSIIFVTDEVDHSNIFGRTPADYLAFFRNIKGARNPHLFKAHAIAGLRSSAPNRSCSAEPADRLLISVDATDGAFLDICTPTNDNQRWADGLKAMSKGVFGFGKRFVLRGEPADQNGDRLVNEKDIEVFVNGNPRPPQTSSRSQVWLYDPVSNSVEFTALFVPESGSQITIVYKIGCGNGG